MAKASRQRQDFLAGLTVDKLLRIPRLTTDGTPTDGDVWINSTDNLLKYREDGITYSLSTTAGAVDAEQVRDIIGAALVAGTHSNITVTYGATQDTADRIDLAVTGLTSTNISDFQTAARAAISILDTATLDLSYTAGQISGVVLDSPKLGGQTLTQVRDHSQTTGARALTGSGTTAASNVIVGRVTAGGGAVEELTATQVKTLLAIVAANISDFTEAAQDAVGTILTDSTSVDFTYDDVANTITAVTLDSPKLGGQSLAQVRDFSQTTGTRTATGAITQATGRLLGRVTAAAGATEELTSAQVKTLLSLVAADISDFTTAVVTAVNAASNIDADTLGGVTAATIQTNVTAAIVNGAQATLDTLNELAAAIGNDPNFATTIANNIGTRSRFFNAALPSGAVSGTVTHNLNTIRCIVQVIVTATGREEDYDVVRTANTVVVTDETGGTIPAGREVLITTAA